MKELINPSDLVLISDIESLVLTKNLDGEWFMPETEGLSPKKVEKLIKLDGKPEGVDEIDLIKYSDYLTQ